MLVFVIVFVYDVLVNGVRMMVIFHLNRHMNQDTLFAGGSGTNGRLSEQQHKDADGGELKEICRGKIILRKVLLKLTVAHRSLCIVIRTFVAEMLITRTDRTDHCNCCKSKLSKTHSRLLYTDVHRCSDWPRL